MISKLSLTQVCVQYIGAVLLPGCCRRACGPHLHTTVCFSAEGIWQLPSLHIRHSWLCEQHPLKCTHTHKHTNLHIQLGVIESF